MTTDTHPTKQLANPWRVAGWTAAALVLIAPLIAMHMTDEVNWTPIDFVLAAMMLIGAGGAIELAVRTTRSAAYRAGAMVAVAGAFLLIWLNAAVGIIGSERNDANMLFAAVLVVAAAGAVLVRWRPAGMMRVMLATALVQAGIGLLAVALRLGAGKVGWPGDVLGLTGFFSLLWLGAAGLFRRAAAERA